MHSSLLVCLALLGCGSIVNAQVSLTTSVVRSWDGGSEVRLAFRNTGSSAVCGAQFSLTVPSGTTFSGWNMNSVGNNQFTLPSWLNIAPGATYSDTGMTLTGSGQPTVRLISSTPCSGGGGSATTTTARPAATTTRAATTTTRAATTTTRASGGGSSMVVTTDPANAAINSCLRSSATGPITSQLNQPISGGRFTFYGAGGTGACGMNSALPAMSAAGSGNLFNSNQQWVAPCTGTQWVLNDAVCMNKCVRIQYTCVGCSSPRTLTVPINNKCPECTPDHVDLSEPAFLYLEPQGGTVGIARNATITYIECP
uniref:Expansin n=1 Tax=Pratylenchus penetrans TaxID=45929 RepID=A0A6G8RR46_PRAPE|nr:expansin [Pratylenchus penetrans]